MARKKQEDRTIEAFIWRLVLTFVGLIVAVVFLRDRKEIMKSYRELRAENPFVAWIVKWAFIALMVITITTVSLIVRVSYLLLTEN